MEINELIAKLQEIESKYGDVQVNVWKKFDQQTVRIDGLDYDDSEKDVCIVVY